MVPNYPTTKTLWIYFALALSGLVVISLVLSVLIFYALSDSSETRSIRRMMNKLTGVSTPTKHTEGFECMASYEQTEIPGSPMTAPNCPERTEEMLYGAMKLSSLVFRLCCFMEVKISQLHCKGLVRCGPPITQRHCAATDVLTFLDSRTMKRGYDEGSPGSGGWCPLEDEATCCIMDVVENGALSRWDKLAHLLKNQWGTIIVVGNYLVLMVIFIPPFVMLVVGIYSIANADL